MVAEILAPEAMKPNIPAWKRLGLKLKSAQQESVPYALPVVVAPAVHEPKKGKRKRDIKGHETQLGKRVKVKNSAKFHEPTADVIANQSPSTSSHKRRKSVTFTPETKIEDGDSVKQLYNGWVAKHPSQGLKFDELRSRSTAKSSESSTPIEQADFAIDEVLQEVEAANKPKKEKKAKKAKPLTSQKAIKSTRDLDPALSYLKRFSDSINTWKFNKIHQISLLKNAFDIEKIPSEYIELFYSYIAGLKGRARTQLRDACITVKVKAQEDSSLNTKKDMDDRTPDEELESSLEDKITAPDLVSKIGYEEKVLEPFSDLTIKQRMAKRMRAERILDELAQEEQGSGEPVIDSPESFKDEEGDHESQKRLKMSDGSIQRVRRKRKQRTNAVDGSSSSDSSDSDSSSDEDEEDENAKDTADDESSSSSSSSSSTSEDEEGSGSSGSESGSSQSQ